SPLARAHEGFVSDVEIGRKPVLTADIDRVAMNVYRPPHAPPDRQPFCVLDAANLAVPVVEAVLHHCGATLALDRKTGSFAHPCDDKAAGPFTHQRVSDNRRP